MPKPSRPSLLAILLARLRPESATRKPVSGAKPPRPYQAISIHRGTVCCPMAKKIDGVRFLAKHIPQLPLPECTMRGGCQCSYLKHSDRRADARRLSDFGMKQPLFGSRERRQTARGRRAKD